MYITDEDQAPIEPMLLSALKEVSDPELRREIEEALSIKPAKEKPSKKQVKAVEEIAEKLEELKNSGLNSSCSAAEAHTSEQ